MDHKQFQEWLSGIDHLSPAQRQQTEAMFPGDTETSASLAAIVEADEPCVPESRKGARNLERKARRRGGKASKRGLSDEQVPVLGTGCR